MKPELKSSLITDVLEPETYGFLKQNLLYEEPYILYVASPFIRLDSFMTSKEVCRRCKAIIGQYTFPYTQDVSYIWNFAKQNAIQFKNIKLSEVVLRPYRLYKGCVCINLAKPNECEKYLIVYIPKDVKYINFINDPYVIGISANTVDLSHVKELALTGKVYGAMKNYGLFRKVYDDGRVIRYKGGLTCTRLEFKHITA